jgi:hypothetical protein
MITPLYDQTDKIDISAVYKELNNDTIFRSKKTKKLFKDFVNALSNKSSFAHRVHKSFKELQNNPS